MSAQYICCCIVPADPLKFEAFISEAFPIQQYLAGVWCSNVSLGAEGMRMRKLHVPLLLFEYS
jgi:hypothetical protein